MTLEGIFGAQSAATARPINKSQVNFRHAELDLVRDDKGRPIWNIATASEILRKHPDWIGVFQYNEMASQRIVTKQIPDAKLRKHPRSIEDEDYSAALAWFNRNGFPHADAKTVMAAIKLISKDDSFDPLTNFLTSLKWDGVPRISNWLSVYLGADDATTTRAYGRSWLVSAVARGLRPGCKADHMLVLEGGQGRGKSSAIIALCGNDDWFTDGLPPMGTKEAADHLRGKWIIEVAELEAMRRESDVIKAFLTRRTDKFRPAYGHEEIEAQRRCVFIGTTNKDEWLNDNTGGRRFWPVKVGNIDLEALKRDRLQLWAEAASALKAGEEWWLSSELSELAAYEQAGRIALDPWHGTIEDFISNLGEVSPSQILQEAMYKTVQDLTRKDSNRVADILKTLGWRRDGKITRGPYKDSARYIR